MLRVNIFILLIIICSQLLISQDLDKTYQELSAHYSFKFNLLTGRIYYENGKLDSGAYYFLNALKQNYDDPRKNTEENKIYNKGFIYDRLAKIYGKTGEYKKALSHFFKALEYYSDVKDTLAKAWIYNSMGLLNYRKGLNESALDYFKKSYRIRKNLKDSIETLNILANIGLI